MVERAKGEGIAIPPPPAWSGGISLLAMTALILLPFCHPFFGRIGLPVLPTLAAGWLALVALFIALTQVRLKEIGYLHPRLGAPAA